MEKVPGMLGILGGLGPAASAYFYEMITEHTKAACDQDHIDIVISSRATTPDRTAYIVGESENSPLSAMMADAKRLEQFGAQILVMPCNTAHYFYDSLRDAVSVPFLNIIELTVRHCIARGAKKIGVFATSGTVDSMSYQRVCRRLGVKAEVPSPEGQKKIMDMIYGSIKQGKKADEAVFGEVTEEMKERGCDCVVLGCTELSLLKKQMELGSYFVDSLEVLAYESIKSCGKEPIGFTF